jgi:hypothetical protein
MRIPLSSFDPKMNKLLLMTMVAVCFSMVRAVESSEHIAAMLSSPENVAIVANPERIEACILYRRSLLFTKDESKRKYREGWSENVLKESARVLAATLVNEQSYIWDTKKFCMPVWNARLKFYRDGRCLSADFCFGCDIVVFSRDGNRIGDGSFDRSSDAIFAVIRSMFPDDKIVRHIVEAKKKSEEHRAMIQRLKEEAKKETDERSAPQHPAS